MFDYIKEALQYLTDVRGLIQWGGISLVGIIVFVETGLFVGFFLPGDSLLVTAGIFASAGYLNIGLLLLVGSVCAVAGDQVGYWIGRRAGQALYSRDDSLIFKKSHLKRAHEFYEKYGRKTIVLARFVPVIRTFAPPVAGAANMNYRQFTLFNILGGILWVWSMILAGYFLAATIPNAEKHLHIIIAAVIVISIIPAVIEAIRQHRDISGAIAGSDAEKFPE